MNSVNMLQELMVAEKQKLPLYTFESFGNPPETKFTCSVSASDIKGVGEGTTKRSAKCSAAESALSQLGHDVSCKKPRCTVKPLPVHTVNAKVSQLISETALDFSENKNYVGELHEFATNRRVGYPVYESPLFSENGQFKIICKFQDFESIGYAVSKKKAKQIASYKMMLNLNPDNSLNGDELKTPSEEQISSKGTLNGDQILSGDITNLPSEEHISPEDIQSSRPNLKAVSEPVVED